MENKQFLLKSLQLSNYLLKNDEQCKTIATELNSKNLTEEQISQVKNNLKSYLEDAKKNIYLIDAIKNLNLDNTEYLLALIKLKEINIYQDREKSLQTIKEILNNKTIKFTDTAEKFLYYSAVVNITIASKDTTLIELAINKIQEIE